MRTAGVDGADAELGSEAAIGAKPAASRFVVVPRTPGPLRYLRRTKRADDDDIDAAIDELFGDITNEEPGRFDLALLLIGVGLIAWWATSAATGPGLVLGVISIVLGLAIPTRNAIRVANRRWTRMKDGRVMRQGYPLDAGDPNVARLVDAYEHVVRLADRQLLPQWEEALGAAHRAVVETASLLGTSRPSAGPDTEYVRKRARAIRALTKALKASLASADRDRDARDDARDDDEAASRERWTSAVAEARDQLEAQTGLGALSELDALTKRIDTEADRGRRG